MSFVLNSPKATWQPLIAADTTSQSYWLNWRVLLCGICVLLSALFSSLLIWNYEVFGKPARTRRSNGSNMESQKVETSSAKNILYEDETWRPCLRGIHPAWLLAFRVFAFAVLLLLFMATTAVDGISTFYYYTYWTFISITIYFGLGSLFSMHGCYRHLRKASGDKVGDSEEGISDASPLPQSSNPSNHPEKDSGTPEEHRVRQPAGAWGYIFQIMFQMNAGAVMLTDFVFWFIFLPFLAIKDYNISFLTINMHTMNAIFMLGEAALNSLRFPWFRIGYFGLWTFTYVIFQWIFHAYLKLWWPYPFLDLSSSYAPLWYLSVALLHIPCYGIFALIVKLKHIVLSTLCPDSYFKSL